MIDKSKTYSRAELRLTPATASALIAQFDALRNKLDCLDKRLRESGLTLPEVKSLFASQMSRIDRELE